MGLGANVRLNPREGTNCTPEREQGECAGVRIPMCSRRRKNHNSKKEDPWGLNVSYYKSPWVFLIVFNNRHTGA